MKPCRLLGFQAGVIVYSTEYTFHHCYQITTRYNIQTGMAACYPSSGGIWLADLGPVELRYLGKRGDWKVSVWSSWCLQ